ncbi:MAG: HU family DNA-binding protein [Chloroflexi bacterium]|nr:HU family DNA-binding protein [Chloroflexota bacterium]
MTKTELCQHMTSYFAARGRRFNRADARAFFEELRRLCAERLDADGHFSIPKVVRIHMVTRRARRGRDPITGGPMRIPPRRVAQARVSDVIRKIVERPP